MFGSLFGNGNGKRRTKLTKATLLDMLDSAKELDRGQKQELAEQAEYSIREERRLQMKLEEQQMAAKVLSSLHEGKLADAEERAQEAEATCARIVASHATRVRIGAIPVFNAIEMTARIRAVEGSLRCETDGSKIVAYGDHQLTEAQWNALVAAGTPQWDRT